MNSNVRNILRNIGFLISVPVIIGAFVFAVSEDKSSSVKAIEVDILNPEFGFVTVDEVRHSLMNENIILDYSMIEQLDIASLEEKINSNPWVEYAEVYVTSNQSVKVKLKQVHPKLRVQRTDSTANGYYLDDKGFLIPLSRTFSANLPILTSERRITSIDQRKDLVKLAQYIEKDTFWRATISQINLDRNNDIELVSLIGDANIRFGTTENMEDKFFRLFQFYKKGINRINWANVKELDIRFARQIVCRRYHKESHIEETNAPTLYATTKPDAGEPVSFPEVESPKREPALAAPKEAPGKKKVLAEVPKPKPEPKKKVLKQATPEVKKEPVVVKKEKKVEQVKKTIVKPPAPTPQKKATAQVKKDKPAPPKPKKKKREIIINTEPVTLKNATQK